MDNGAWYLLLYMLLETDMLDYIHRAEQELEASRAFREYADGCPHLVVEQNGNAYERICRHPARDDPSDWVTCDRGSCPFMILNASPEQRERYDHALALESLDAHHSGEHPCEGCAHLEWEADMGKHMPWCGVEKRYCTDRCGMFEPSELYRMYMDMTGEGNEQEQSDVAI